MVLLFSVGEDEMQFIPVEKANDKYQGYQFVEDKDLNVSLFTFIMFLTMVTCSS